MIISAWPGPKGEIIEARNGRVHKFCSTTDMFSWLLQPENQQARLAVYVHDMSASHWDQPNDEHLIDARQAVYVLGSEKMGMGPTLASFASEQAAEQFRQQHGGEVLHFADINLDVLQRITRMGLDYMQDGSQHSHSLH